MQICITREKKFKIIYNDILRRQKTNSKGIKDIRDNKIDKKTEVTKTQVLKLLEQKLKKKLNRITKAKGERNKNTKIMV